MRAVLAKVLAKVPDDALLRVAATAYRDWQDAPPHYVMAAEDAYLLLLNEVLSRKLGDELLQLTTTDHPDHSATT